MRAQKRIIQTVSDCDVWFQQNRATAQHTLHVLREIFPGQVISNRCALSLTSTISRFIPNFFSFEATSSSLLCIKTFPSHHNTKEALKNNIFAHEIGRIQVYQIFQNRLQARIVAVNFQNNLIFNTLCSNILQ